MSYVGAHYLFEYVAWFRDESLPPDHQDYEWPGCVWIEAADSESAQRWGDELAKSCPDKFLRSTVEPWLDPVPEGQPFARVGQRLTNAEIGW